MRTDDPIILKRLEDIERACAGLRMACGFPDPHAPTSRQEGRKPITVDAARALIHREWENYPDLAVLQDELTDRGLTKQTATALLIDEEEARAVGEEVF